MTNRSDQSATRGGQYEVLYVQNDSLKKATEIPAENRLPLIERWCSCPKCGDEILVTIDLSDLSVEVK